MSTKLYCFDLDGTLADLTHRLHYIKNPLRNDNSDEIIEKGPEFIKKHQNWKPNWDRFFEEVDKDTPIQWVIDLLDIVRRKGAVLILSGRSGITETKTREWLKRYNILYDYLIMRPVKNHKPDYLLKKWMLEDFLRDFLLDKDFQVQFIVDDRSSVIKMWRENGYNVLQCNAWKE